MTFVVIISLLNQATPFLLKFIVDSIEQAQKGQPVTANYIGLLVVLILVVNLSVTIISNVSGFIGDRLGVKLNNLLSQRYYDHILKLPLDYFDNEVTGRVTSRLDRSIATVSSMIQSFTNNFIGFFLTSVITIIVLAFYSPIIAVLLAALFPLYIWLTTLSSKVWQQHQEKINQNIDYANGRFVESIGQIRVVKSFVREVAESIFFAEKREAASAEARIQSLGWHKYDIVRRVGLNVVFFIIYGFIVWQTYTGNYSFGTMVLLLQLTSQAQFPLFASSFIVESIQRAASGSKDYFEVMEMKPAIEDRPSAKDITVKRAEIDYQNVSFSYGEGKQVLRNISFSLKPGSKLALVGESGEGKTTIANLLLRFYEPNGGTITIDGQDVGLVTQSSLREQIGVVFQEPALFSGTVAENIRYGNPGATDAQMIQAAKAANAHDFVSKLANGYDTEIGERGVKLSGGQKQRIAIARAILKDAPILILDEATSSLDSKAEREVQDALEVLMKRRTTLIIAHRLSTIQNVDIIVGLKGGEVSEMGTPAELAKGKGIYAELLKLQTPTKANKAKLKKYDLAR
jgi:ATP-binding cassette, subfamily B, bacterial